jgi:hypothetical protein
MGKRLILVLALAFVVCTACSAFAAVQNVKISGDILLQAIDRNNFSLSKTGDDNVPLKYRASGFLSTVRVRVDADLTDNVSATVRLLNERSWGEENTTMAGWTAQSKNTNVDLDLAYVTLKEFLYAPITLTLGRQELHFGNELIIGDPDTNWYAQEVQVPWDLSARKSFDAVRATFNYEPLVVDVIYSKIRENDTWWGTIGTPEKRDIDLWGMNILYDMSALGFKGTGEAYYFGRIRRGADETNFAPFLAGTTLKEDTCHTVGVLVKGQIVKDLTGSIEGAYQFGRMNWEDVAGGGSALNLERHAFAAQLALNYNLPFEKIKKYQPMIGMIYAYLSGEKDGALDGDSVTTGHHGNYSGWDPMFENQTAGNIVNAIFPNTNVQYWVVKGSIKPWEDITLSGNYGYYRLVRNLFNLDLPSFYGGGAYEMTTGQNLGQEVDVNATYDYTEDVQFGLTCGMFVPGDAFNKGGAGEGNYKKIATQMIGSMKVTF